MVHHITVATSIEASGDAFDGTGPDTLVVDAGAFLISETTTGAKLTGSWTVAINGQVGTFNSDGLTIFDASTVTVGRRGEVFGNTHGIFALGSLTLTNLGIIRGEVRTNGVSHIVRTSCPRQ
jgi:hypothetical protein